MDIWAWLTPVLYVAVILVATWLIARLASVVVGRLLLHSMPLVATQARRAGWVIVWVVGVILAVEQLGVRSDILLLMVALFGFAAIIALRGPMENIAARYFSDMYLPFKVGDSIEVQGHAGKVIEVNSMATILLADDDRLVSIPSSTLMREAVVNTTPQAWKEVVVPIALPGDVDVATFESAVLKSLNKLKLHLDERFPPILTTKSRGPQSTELSLTVMIRQPGERDVIATEINQRIGEVLATIKVGRKPKVASEPSPPTAAG
jgi:small conductance mechanosensitive channel